jgi:nicotinamidase-related amidase
MGEAYVRQEDLDRKLEEWLAQIARYDRPWIDLDPAHAVLLVVDLQRAFTDPRFESFLPAVEAILPRVNRLVAAFHAAGRPVLFTRHAHPREESGSAMERWWKELLREGTEEAELDPRLDRRPGDPVVTKRRYDAFFDTPLEKLLRRRGAKGIVLAGVMTNLCCETTARSAFVRDFDVFFVADGTAAVNEAFHRGSLANLAMGFARVVGSGWVEERIERWKSLGTTPPCAEAGPPIIFSEDSERR